MNIVLSTDNNFVQHCCVAMTSVLKNNEDVHFFILTEGLNNENQKILSKTVFDYGGSIDYCIVDSATAAQFPMPKGVGDHISVATYYRLFVALLLPETIEKIIYMDCDVVVRSSLKAYWDTNLTNYAMGIVYQEQNHAQIEDKIRLGIPSEYGYFNAGILLINLAYWRTNNITDKLFDFVRFSFDKIKQHDQDVLNAILYNVVTPVDYIWNYLPLFDATKPHIFPQNVDYTKVMEPVNIHFVSTPKPWEIGSYNPYTYEYYHYLDMTPYKGWRPKFNWNKYWNHVLKIKIIRFIGAVDFLGIRKLIKRLYFTTKS